MARKPPGQLPLPARRTWGGKRPGAGRKPRPGKRPVDHRARPKLASRFPVHVTLRVARHVWQLRSRRCYSRLERAFFAGCERNGCRVVHYSVQANHVHLICEAADAPTLSRGIQGLAIRMARALNRVMGSKGQVFAERYHAHILRTPSETRRAICYVLQNARRHGAQYGQTYSPGWIDPCSSAVFFTGWREPTGPPAGPVPVACAHSWLLLTGWKKAGLISRAEVPGKRG